MKHAHSLEEERQALLEQIHSSRAAYRRMLAQYDEPEAPASSTVHRHIRNMPAAFPRSLTMRWVMDHPYAVAGIAAGLVALAAIGPRRAIRTVQSAPLVRKLQQRVQEPAQRLARQPLVEERVVYAQRPSAGRAAIAGLTGAVTMMLRDPAKVRMLARAAATATDWWKRRQQQTGTAKSRNGRAWQ